MRDWLYVADHCKAIDLVVTHGRIGEVYNIGGHNEMRNIDIVRLICRKLYGKPSCLPRILKKVRTCRRHKSAARKCKTQRLCHNLHS